MDSLVDPHSLNAPQAGPADLDTEYSLLELAQILLRYRVALVLLVFAGMLAGAAFAFVPKRWYSSTASFVPQASEGGMSGIALAASQFGVRVPNAGGGWTPGIYVELLRSRALLDSILLDSLLIADKGPRKVAVLDLLEIAPGPQALRLEFGLQKLRTMIVSGEDRKQGSVVTLAVRTPWPEFSRAVASRLIEGVNQFNLVSRQSQARAERKFVETLAQEARSRLRWAEDDLQRFLQSNRGISSSPQLEFERNRIERDVSMKQQMYATLEQNREEARIREVRDSPVITVLEEPRLPATPESRSLLLKLLIGSAIGFILGALTALLLNAYATRRARAQTAVGTPGPRIDTTAGPLASGGRSRSTVGT